MYLGDYRYILLKSEHLRSLRNGFVTAQRTYHCTFCASLRIKNVLLNEYYFVRLFIYLFILFIIKWSRHTFCHLPVGIESQDWSASTPWPFSSQKCPKQLLQAVLLSFYRYYSIRESIHDFALVIHRNYRPMSHYYVCRVLYPVIPATEQWQQNVPCVRCLSHSLGLWRE